MLIGVPQVLSSAEVQQIHDNAYTEGYNAGYTDYPISHPPLDNGDSYNEGYNAGYAQYPIDNPPPDDRYCEIVNNSSVPLDVNWQGRTVDPSNGVNNAYHISCPINSSVVVPFSIIMLFNNKPTHIEISNAGSGVNLDFSHEFDDSGNDYDETHNTGHISGSNYSYVFMLKDFTETVVITDV